jgi:hypothetical protein
VHISDEDPGRPGTRSRPRLVALALAAVTMATMVGATATAAGGDTGFAVVLAVIAGALVAAGVLLVATGRRHLVLQ